MKKVFLAIVLLMISISAFGQVYEAPLSQEQRDSVLLQISHRLDKNAKAGRYKIYPTKNVYTSLRLDTFTGEVWAIQIGLGEDTTAGCYKISEKVGPEMEWYNLVGRYELYPTENMYNFILLNTVDGFVYQVQWSIDKNKRGRWMLFEIE